ncbi:hypothetical protein MHBO_002869 [Bonamia ostreae]
MINNKKHAKCSFVFASVFNATKHLRVIENLIKSRNIPFNTAVIFSNKKSSSNIISSDESMSNISEEFEDLKNVSMENLFEIEYPINSEKFYQMVFSNNSTYSLIDFFNEEDGYSNIKISKWQFLNKMHVRNISFEYEMKDIPFLMKSIASNIKVSRIEKLIKNKNSFSLCVNIQTPEISYGSFFEIFHLYSVKNISKNKSNLIVKYGIKIIKRIPFLQNKIVKK